jgi:hypothetical protein
MVDQKCAFHNSTQSVIKISSYTIHVGDWAILGLEASLAGVLTGHPAVS